MTGLFKSGITIKDTISKAKDYLETKGVETPRLDAEVLLAFVLGKTRADLFKDPDLIINEKESGLFEKFLERRGNREPVSYIRGFKEFYSFEFKVNKNVLAPRPDTEILLDTALKYIDECGKRDIKVADIGTGSGILAVLIAKLKNLSFIYATDLSLEALEVAKENARLHGVEDRVRFVRSDMFSSLEGKFDLIICNPPYVKSREIDELQKEISVYEPRMALDGGEDGLKFVSLLVKDGIKYLENSGSLMIEIGDGQADMIKNLPGLRGYSNFGFLKDYSQKDRVLFLKR